MLFSIYCHRPFLSLKGKTSQKNCPHPLFSFLHPILILQPTWIWLLAPKSTKTTSSRVMSDFRINVGIQDTFSRPHLICQYLTLLTAGIFSSWNALFLFWPHPALVFLRFLDHSCSGPFPHSDCLTGWWTWEFFKVACLPFSSVLTLVRIYTPGSMHLTFCLPACPLLPTAATFFCKSPWPLPGFSGSTFTLLHFFSVWPQSWKLNLLILLNAF